MVICVCAFTKKGNLLQEKLKQVMAETLFIEKDSNENLADWTKWCFEHHLPVVFIGATGIAVRTIAPFVENKLTDSPVVVIDELGKFIIPILSGHVGGANKIARDFAERLGGTAVITTATDLEDKFSIDVFARENGFKIENKEGIKQVAQKILNDEKVLFWVSPLIVLPECKIPSSIVLTDESDIKVDVCIYADEEKNELPDSLLYLSCKNLCLGMGCKKGKTFDELNEALKSVIAPNQLDKINSLSTINLKKDELGLQMLSQYYHWSFVTYESEKLEKAMLTNGDTFSESSFVKDVTGVSNVCERAAVCSAGNGSEIVIKKTCVNGITIALAKQKPCIKNWSI